MPPSFKVSVGTPPVAVTASLKLAVSVATWLARRSPLAMPLLYAPETKSFTEAAGVVTTFVGFPDNALPLCDPMTRSSEPAQ